MPWTIQSIGGNTTDMFFSRPHGPVGGFCHMSFKVRSVHSCTSSNHCPAGLPRGVFPSTLPCRMLFARVPFPFTIGPNSKAQPLAVCLTSQCLLQLSCVPPGWAYVTVFCSKCSAFHSKCIAIVKICTFIYQSLSSKQPAYLLQESHNTFGIQF